MAPAAAGLPFEECCGVGGHQCGRRRTKRGRIDQISLAIIEPDSVSQQNQAMVEEAAAECMHEQGEETTHETMLLTLESDVQTLFRQLKDTLSY